MKMCKSEKWSWWATSILTIVVCVFFSIVTKSIMPFALLASAFEYSFLSGIGVIVGIICAYFFAWALLASVGADHE